MLDDAGCGVRRGTLVAILTAAVTTACGSTDNASGHQGTSGSLGKTLAGAAGGSGGAGMHATGGVVASGGTTSGSSGTDAAGATHANAAQGGSTGGGGATTQGGNTSATGGVATGGIATGGVAIGATAGTGAAGASNAQVGAGGRLGIGGTTTQGGSSGSPTGGVTPGGAAGTGQVGTAGSVNVVSIPLACTKATASIPTSAACVPTIATSARLANVGLVFDRSGSMTQTPAGFAAAKWTTLSAATTQVVSDFKDSGLGLGLLLFPDAGSFAVPPTSCETATGPAGFAVGVESIETAGPKIVDVMGQITPIGGTPMAATLSTALSYFTQGSGATLLGRKYLLLLTDGGANCNATVTCGGETCTANLDKSGSCGTGVANCCDPALQVAGGLAPQTLCMDDAAVLTQLGQLALAGIKTFVVGLPGSEVYSNYLDSFAVAGGTALITGAYKYYRIEASSGTAGTVATIESILRQTTRSCMVPLTSRLVNPSRTELLVDCTLLPRSNASGQSQWIYDDNVQNPSVTLLGGACDSVATGGAKRIDVVDTCPSGG